MNPALSTGTARGFGNGSFVGTSLDEGVTGDGGRRRIPEERSQSPSRFKRGLDGPVRLAGSLLAVAVPYRSGGWLIDSWSHVAGLHATRQSHRRAIMWILIPRLPTPDAPHWPGRRMLAAADAVIWPLAWAVWAARVSPHAGIVGPMVIALAALCAIRRTHRALWVNHRYFFTAWRWARLSLVLVIVATALRLALPT